MNTRNFLIFEKTVTKSIYLILNFRKLLLYNEHEFLNFVQMNEEKIKSELQQLEYTIEHLKHNHSKYANRNVAIEENTNYNESEIHSMENSSDYFIEWELDLSFNFFEEISIDEILCILIQQGIVGTCKKQKGKEHLLCCDNLNTLNLRKNCLKIFPCIKNYKLIHLTNIYISHNNLGPVENENKLETSKNRKKKDFVNHFDDDDNDEMEGILNNSLENVEYVNFQNNDMESFALVKYLFNNHKKLAHLNISFNKLKSLNDLPILQNLKSLNVSLNKLSFVNTIHYKEKNERILKDCNYTECSKNDAHSVGSSSSYSDIILSHLVQTLQKHFPKLGHIDMKFTPVYDLIKETIKKKNSSFPDYFPF